MMIDTTIHIDRCVLAVLDDSAAKAGVSRTYFVSCLMRRIGHGEVLKARAWVRVRYQERREKSMWRRMHVSLGGDEYEYFRDLSKVFKLSVSFIVARAVELFVDEILGKLMKGYDNYHYHNYVFMQYIIQDVHCLVLYWGIPEKLMEPPA